MKSKIIMCLLFLYPFFLNAYTIETGQQKKKPKTEKSINKNQQRCKAITKEGTQCKRNAEKGSIYCWQHKKDKTHKTH